MKLEHSEIIIISNETGKWMSEGREFATLEEAEQAADDIVNDSTDALIIINDAGPCNVKKDTVKHAKNQAKNKYTNRSKKNTVPGDKYDCKRGNRRKDSEYNHTWV